MEYLNDKVIIISGASSGIGRASAHHFASLGAKLVLTARREEELSNIAAEINKDGGQAIYVAGDAVNADVHQKTVEAALTHYGRLDAAFNNVGDLGEMLPFGELSYESWTKTLNVNLNSAFLAAKHQLPEIQKQSSGSLLFTSTFVGHSVGFPGMVAYGAAKAGLIGLMRVLAVENAEHNIRVNAIMPGGVDTPMGRTAADTPESLSFVKNLHALKRIGDPEEIAKSAGYLLSDIASFVTGTTHYVDGGLTITRT